MHDIISAITDFIFVEDAPVKADVIIVVGSAQPEAAECAARLWHDGCAPVVFIGGGVSIKTGVFPGPRSKADVYDGDYATEYDFYRDVLMKNDVPTDAIIGENRSGYTRQNAEFARECMDNMNLRPRTALLVCKAFHARRSLMFFSAAFPDVDFRVIPYAGYDVTRDSWFMSEYGVTRVLGELKRCGDQFGMDDISSWLQGQRTKHE